ncbi:nitroreductase [Sphingobium lactosutens]|uniref:nitroreductase n=1 Tax=Sphingobium lactosutens TaxID=522773 RepID=UPI0015B933B8|nr:nitroreductase [Sphingobium lactosutens]NWK98598.1 nitroreductase [Sphingobium lactosutens]
MTNPPLPPSSAELFEAIVNQRRSVRAFLPQPIAPELIERLFTIAGKAPSNCNVQPWITHVVSGSALSRVRALLLEEAQGGRMDPDVPLTSHYVEQYQARRIGSAMTLFRATGVERGDRDARTRSFLRNYELFDAPHAAFFFMPRYFGLREAADIGLYVQTLMLALTAHGLGSCPQGAISHFSGALKRELGVSDDLICLFGLSFGNPDFSHASAAAITDRASLSELVVMHE